MEDGKLGRKGGGVGVELRYVYDYTAVHAALTNGVNT